MNSLPCKNNFNPKDSGFVFSIALLAINIISLLAVNFMESYDFLFSAEAKFYFPTVLIQLTLFLVCMIYCNVIKVPFWNSLRIKGGLKKEHTAATVIAGIVMPFVLIVPAMYFLEFFKLFGYTAQTMDIKIDSVTGVVIATGFLCIIPAVCEEILFRGIILQGLRKFGDVFAVLLSAVMFMLFHTNPTQTLYPLLSGLLLGFVFVKTGRLIFPVIIHFFNNFLNVISDYLYNVYDINFLGDFPIFKAVDIIVFAVCLIVFSCCVVFFFKQKTASNVNRNLKVLQPVPDALGEENFSALQENNSTKKDFEKAAVEDNGKNGLDWRKFILKEADKLFKKGYTYNKKKNVFVLQDRDDNEPVPQGFADVSQISFFNPFAAEKGSFFIYGLFGFIDSILMWILAFISI